MNSPSSSPTDRDLAPPPRWVLPCRDLEQAVAWFAGNGYRLHSLVPADNPRYAMVEQSTDPTQVIRLDVDAHRRGVIAPFLEFTDDRPGTEPEAGLFPSGSMVRVGRADDDPPAADPTGRVVMGGVDDDDWVVGRAGMRYRDLLPGRWGGQFIASHIHIPHGGPVPDYVHYHHVDFQLIFCHRGWVRVVYQDQGDPFVLKPGDAILQAPGIRHRVLEASDDLYVVEISSPAEHPTFAEHDVELPNGLSPGRRYGGQDYVHFQVAAARWETNSASAARRCQFGIEAATDGRYRVELIELPGNDGADSSVSLAHNARLQLNVLLEGQMMVSGDALTATVKPGACVALGPDTSMTATSTEPSSILRVTAC